MRLTELTFSEFEGEPREWKLDTTSFGNTNLIVGKNATGKTRLLNVISGLAKLLSGKRADLYDSGCYSVKFESEKHSFVYELKINAFNVELERFDRDGDTLLERGKSGEGEIEAIELGKKIRFQTPPSQLAAVSRRDSIQHPFFDELYEWAISVKHFLFGSEFGRNFFVSPKKNETDSVRNDDEITDPNYVIGIFQRGLDRHGNDFKEGVLKDFATLGYDCSDVSIVNISKYFKEKTQLLGLSVKEKNLNTETTQINMSQGMFRALALVIQLNYTIFEKRPACILIDDIGEGLDFGRSSNMILLLIEKSENSKFQLFMTTNDRFVMNGVPLRYWSVLHRDGNLVKVFNKNNSASVFEEFEFVGLNNFDFFSSEFFLGKKE
jgi:energy-coupling factor transporter ATP-binding protein EcfA2